MQVSLELVLIGNKLDRPFQNKFERVFEQVYNHWFAVHLPMPIKVALSILINYIWKKRHSDF